MLNLSATGFSFTSLNINSVPSSASSGIMIPKYLRNMAIAYMMIIPLIAPRIIPRIGSAMPRMGIWKEIFITFPITAKMIATIANATQKTSIYENLALKFSPIVSHIL